VHVDPAHLYFITTRAVQRAHIFRRDVIKRILVDSLNTGRILGHYALFAYVIMPNHVHLIVRCLADRSPGKVVGALKRTSAGLILRQYEVEGNQSALAFCAAAMPPKRKEQYVVWEHEYQAKNVYSAAFLRQELDYLHNNPVQPHWELAERPEQHVWSSARFYTGDGRALLPLSDARELLI
jgi:putative transposase